MTTTESEDRRHHDLRETTTEIEDRRRHNLREAIGAREAMYEALDMLREQMPSSAAIPKLEEALAALEVLDHGPPTVKDNEIASCETCAFSDEPKGLTMPGARPDLLLCRFAPPTVHASDGGRTWPRVYAADWCGKWEDEQGSR
jgi:hypothetical protein